MRVSRSLLQSLMKKIEKDKNFKLNLVYARRDSNHISIGESKGAPGTYATLFGNWRPPQENLRSATAP